MDVQVKQQVLDTTRTLHADGFLHGHVAMRSLEDSGLFYLLTSGGAPDAPSESGGRREGAKRQGKEAGGDGVRAYYVSNGEPADDRDPSGAPAERYVHAAIFAARPDIKCSIHTHAAALKTLSASAVPPPLLQGASPPHFDGQAPQSETSEGGGNGGGYHDPVRSRDSSSSPSTYSSTDKGEHAAARNHSHQHHHHHHHRANGGQMRHRLPNSGLGYPPNARAPMIHHGRQHPRMSHAKGPKAGGGKGPANGGGAPPPAVDNGAPAPVHAPHGVYPPMPMWHASLQMLQAEEGKRMIAAQVLGQVEFYLGDTNLPYDNFLHNKMKDLDITTQPMLKDCSIGRLVKTGQAWLPLDLIISFKRMQTILYPLDNDANIRREAVSTALQASQHLELSYDHMYVRRRYPLPGTAAPAETKQDSKKAVNEAAKRADDAPVSERKLEEEVARMNVQNQQEEEKVKEGKEDR